MKELLLLFGMILTLCFLCSLFLDGQKQCRDMGGAYVRGAIGFECVAGVK